jgi:hypothetical protein
MQGEELMKLKAYHLIKEWYHDGTLPEALAMIDKTLAEYERRGAAASNPQFNPAFFPPSGR